MTMNYCGKCGAAYEAGQAKFCAKCGNPLRQVIALQEAPEPAAAAAVAGKITIGVAESDAAIRAAAQPHVENVPANDEAEDKRIKKRGLGEFIIFSIITCGIYSLYWTHKLAKDVNAICEGDGKKTSGLLKYFLLCLITFGIYGLFWMYAVEERLQDNAPRYNLTCKESGSTVLLWCILGALIIVGPFIALHIIIKNTNALADEYNKRIPISQPDL
jgi:predicted  nucleic acid-binding Zn-ribbon protein